MSDLTLSSIEEGLSDLRNLGKAETTFEILGHTITLRTLGRPETEDVQVNAGKFLDDESNTMLPWLNEQKYATLAYAIVELDDHDFRGVDTIEVDGDNLSKTYVLKQILNSWDKDVVDVCWRKYEDLVEKSKERIFDQVQFMDKVDLLEKHESRVDELRDKLDKPPLTPESEDVESGETEVDDMDEEDVKDMMFNPDNADDIDFEFGDVDDAKQSEAEAAGTPTREEPLPQQNPPVSEDREIYDPDDPNRELTEDEKRRLRAEEQAFQRRQQQAQQQEQAEQQETAQHLREKRQRLNQQNPTIKEGDVPMQDGEEPTHLKDGDQPDDDDFVDAGTQHLGPST